ncbi:MAG TPA: arginase family protein [Chthoniobacterales bacterium]|jgi:arginase|nr:arginase family protein [Chthoniobacterales bacterium]
MNEWPRLKIVLLDAPSNLGLRPPEDGAAPGCYKLPWAVRDHGLLSVLAAEDGGAVVPPRYRAAWSPGDGDRNGDAIAAYSLRLADRVGALIDQGTLPIVLGGDCSILVGNSLALARRGRHGLIFLDAHSDFRHPGNAEAIGAAAGEDLAIVTGRGDPRLIDLEGRRPYVREDDVHVIGVRPNDDYIDELEETAITVTPSDEVNEGNVVAVAEAAVETVTRSTTGFWVHLDLDVVDASEMPAADCPEPEGISFANLTTLLRHFLASPRCVGMEMTIYDPDLDPDGTVAGGIVRCLRDAIL